MKKETAMPGTRTAPTVNGTPQFLQVSFTFYDYTGEQRTDTYYVDADSTDAEIEALADALQDGSNGTLWRIKVAQVYNSVGDSQNAIEEVWEETSANLVLLLKAPTIEKGYDFFVPAPVNDMFIEGTESIDPTSAELAAILTALLAVRATYSAVSARFTSRRDIGTKINF